MSAELHNPWLIPVRFRIAGSGRAGDRLWDHVEARQQEDGSLAWVATDGHSVLNKRGEWEWEPNPSSRSDAFRKRTRFATPEEALAAWDRRNDSTR